MQSDKRGITREIRTRISESKSGSLFFVSDFLDLDKDEMVGKILSQSEKQKKLIRLSNGVYYKPEYSRFGVVYPSIDTIVSAIAKRDKVEILPTGSVAMHQLGLSTQIPMNAIYITSGSGRTIQMGERKIVFRRTVPKNFAYKSKLISIIIQAMKSIGKENVTEDHLQTIRMLLLDSEDRMLIRDDLRNAPIWIKKMLLPLIP